MRVCSICWKVHCSCRTYLSVSSWHYRHDKIIFSFVYEITELVLRRLWMVWMGVSWVDKILDFLGDVLLQTNRLLYLKLYCDQLCSYLGSWRISVLCACLDSGRSEPVEWWWCWVLRIWTGIRDLWICTTFPGSQYFLWRLPRLWKLPSESAAAAATVVETQVEFSLLISFLTALMCYYHYLLTMESDL